MNQSALTLHFAPLLPEPIVWTLAGLVALCVLASIFVFRRGLVWRGLCAGAFVLALLNPAMLEEQREAVPDTVVIVADKSASQNFNNRAEVTNDALAGLDQFFKNYSDIDVRIVSAGNERDRDTRLFSTIDQALSDIPVQRRAGVIILSDGQIHDAPRDNSRIKAFGPVHTLLTGSRGERDRQLQIIEAPSYGIVGQTVTVKFRVTDSGATPSDNEYATLLIRANDEKPDMQMVPVNTDQTVTFNVAHAGQNILDLEVSPLPSEITAANNRIPLIVNGVRDRLRVLLVSGYPYAGERTWRDFLTSDPGVDLVHFTILREPQKLDMTPQHEMSLIAFPFRELFELKLYNFDLIIFDQYTMNKVLPNFYFANIARYVQEGGAVLEASGPSFAGENSLYQSVLNTILPGEPTGRVIEKEFTPGLTDLGLRHPVTQHLLDGKDVKETPWGPWMRQTELKPKSGDVLMNGANNSPLLILDRVGKGRVAHLASEQIWLWSRGFMGGGPHADLLRRLAHWLMKEPDLEENALVITADGGDVVIQRRNLHNALNTVTLRHPDGKAEDVTLKQGEDGWLSARVTASQPGVYSAEDETQKRFAVIGELNPPEMRAVVTTDDIMRPVAETSGGTVQWLSGDSGNMPDIRFVGPGRSAGGNGWIGLRDNNAFTITGARDVPFLPGWAYALGLLALAIASWWMEGRRSKK